MSCYRHTLLVEHCDDIERYVAYCATCNSCKSHQQKEPIQLHAVPDCAWQICCHSIARVGRKLHLVLTDSCSGWIEIDQLQARISVPEVTPSLALGT